MLFEGVRTSQIERSAKVQRSPVASRNRSANAKMVVERRISPQARSRMYFDGNGQKAVSVCKGNDPVAYVWLSVLLRASTCGVGLSSLTSSPVGLGTGRPIDRASSNNSDRLVMPVTHHQPRKSNSE
jgi:hypothetical protein